MIESVIERVSRWADRHPLQARLSAILFVLTCAGFALFM